MRVLSFTSVPLMAVALLAVQAQGRSLLSESASESASESSSDGFVYNGDFMDLAQGYNCLGDYVTSGIEDVSSLNKCKTMCADLTSCNGLTYNQEAEKCYLKKFCSRFEWKDDDAQRSAVKVVADAHHDDGTSKKAFADLPFSAVEGNKYGFRCSGDKLGEQLDDIDSIESCKDLCDKDKNCAAISFRTTKDVCQLYSNCDWYNFSFEEFTAVVLKFNTYIEVPTDYNCDSSKSIGVINDISSDERCMAQCDDVVGCFAITYNFEEKRCFLKSSCDEYEYNDENKSFRKI